MSLIRKIKDYYNKNNCEKPLLFTTPSHAQGNFINNEAKELLGEQFFKCDFSEIEGFDNLRTPDGILKKLQEKLSRIYKSKSTFLLTNGSTSGVIALMSAVLKEKDKVLTARNCHVSVYNGLVFTGAKPIWFLPEYDGEWGICEGIKAETIEPLLKLHKDVKALILTSPTYEGVYSDVEGISKVCARYGVKLIVDEAHGALLPFAKLKAKPSILCGADVSVQSLHKTAGAPNPCAVVHISKNSSIEPQKVQECLNLINTTSPSYPLMAAIEACVEFLSSKDGEKYLENLLKNIEKLKKTVSSAVSIYEKNSDPAKLLIKIKNMSGNEACEVLNKKFKIEEEYSNNKAMLFITGVGTDSDKLERLSKALNSIEPRKIGASYSESFEYSLPDIVYTPREAFQKADEIVQTNKAAGRISNELIIKYPPGIPVILPGELITEDIISKTDKEYIKVCR